MAIVFNYRFTPRLGILTQESFELALTRAERAYPLREDNEFYSQSCPFALTCYALLELGNRLAQR